jgi:hypothetical protein
MHILMHSPTQTQHHHAASHAPARSRAARIGDTLACLVFAILALAALTTPVWAQSSATPASSWEPG